MLLAVLESPSFWAAVTVAEASPSLSDSSLLLAESSSCLLARVAGGPFFPGGAVADPFLGNPLVGAEAALIWGIFPEGFALAGDHCLP